MRYMITIHEHADDFAARNNPETAPAYWAAWQSFFANEVNAADPDNTGAALQDPSTATTIRGTQIHDGPFADSKEQLGGLFIVDVDNLDEALKLAAKCPACVKGGVEVRPVLPMQSEGEG
ncbi:MAG: YciI family protein [Pseudomonadota bacterium]